MDLCFVELKKFEKKLTTIRTTLDRWIQFLNNADAYTRETLPKELAEIEPIKKATERLDVMYLNKVEREYYDAQQKRYLDEQSRIIEGIQKGIQEAVDVAVKEAVDSAVKETEMNTATEIAKRLLGLSLSENEIAKITGASVEQIAHIKNKHS